MIVTQYGGKVSVYSNYNSFPSMKHVWEGQVVFESKLAGEGDAISSNSCLVGSDFYYLGQDEAIHKVDLQKIADLLEDNYRRIEGEKALDIDSVVCSGPAGPFISTKRRGLMYCNNKDKRVCRITRFGQRVGSIFTNKSEEVATHLQGLGERHLLVTLFNPFTNKNNLVVLNTIGLKVSQVCSLHTQLENEMYCDPDESYERNHFRNVHIFEISRSLTLVMCVLRSRAIQSYYFSGSNLQLGPYINTFSPSGEQYTNYIFTIMRIKSKDELALQQHHAGLEMEWWVLLGGGKPVRIGLVAAPIKQD
jgi:hypothetical protein